MTGLLAFLPGKKTYIVVAVVIALAVLEMLGVDIPNYDPADNEIGDLLMAAMFGTTRMGIAKGLLDRRG